jgi:transposase-like protein
MGDTLLWEKGSVKMESVEEVKRKSKGKESRFGKRYGFELKLRCVKLRLEEGLPVSLLSKEAGVSKDVIYRWVKAYQERGEAGLRNQGVSSGVLPERLAGDGAADVTGRVFDRSLPEETFSEHNQASVF